MNKHFEDAQYYLKRAGETAKLGVIAELEPVERRFKRLLGKSEAKPEPGRLDAVRAALHRLQRRADGEVRNAIEDARGRFAAYRDRPAESEMKNA